LATFDFTQFKAGINVESLNGNIFTYKSLKDLPIGNESDTTFNLDPAGPAKWRYTGKDFEFGSNGDPVKGIIKGIQAVAGGIPEITFKITGLNLDIATLKSALKSSTKVDDALLINSIFSGNDTFKGGRGADKFYGLDGKDKLYGNDGKDTLNGGNGTDTIAGGKGDDRLTGGASADTFLFDTTIKTISSSNIDRITDFNAAEDKIRIDASIIDDSLAVGALAEAAFVIGDTSLSSVSGARIVYDNTTGALYWDAPGGKKMYQFATLDGTPAVTFENFEIV
jgi:Ca2+-binding RTX toxin-like protein